MLTDSERLFLVVTTGVHHGARVALEQDTLSIVGTSPDCDICLSDAGLDSRHMALTVHGDQINVRCLDGSVQLNGTIVDGVDTVSVDSDETLELVPSKVQVRIVSAAGLAGVVGDGKEPLVEQPIATSGSRSSIHRFRLIAAAIVVTTLMGTYVVAGQVGNREQVSAEPPKKVLQALIDKLSLSEELKIDDLSGRLLISGILPSDDLSHLKAAIRRSPVSAIARITTSEQLLEQVGSVFRTNGYSAKLSYRSDATVVVENLDGESADVRIVADFIRADVANLKELVFAPSGAPDASSNDSAVYLAGAGKRLTTIVDGDIAYIATEDGARYFVGSTLPSGHYVRQITAQGVQVNEGDTISWLQF